MRPMNSRFSGSSFTTITRRATATLPLVRARQRERDDRALAQLTLDPHLASVRFDDVLDDGEAEARAARLPRDDLLDLVEAVEDPPQLIRRDAAAAVADAA